MYIISVTFYVLILKEVLTQKANKQLEGLVFMETQ